MKIAHFCRGYVMFRDFPEDERRLNTGTGWMLSTLGGIAKAAPFSVCMTKNEGFNK